jgi:uncharacterized protein
MSSRRLSRLPRAEAIGQRLPVARGVRARLLGLAMLDASDAAPGLLIPGCRSVHTFGMRFPLDVYFLGELGEVVGVRLGVPPRRIVRQRRARHVVELAPVGS